LSTLAHAQSDAPTANKNWNIGSGVGFTYSLGLTSAGLGGLSTLTPVGGLLPSSTVLIERRLSERLFATFQASLSYSTNQSDTNAQLSSRAFSVVGQLGLRRVFNPGDLIEVSWFANASVGWASGVMNVQGQAIDPQTGSATGDLTAVNTHSLNVRGVTGLAFERELVEALALRFSSSILGAGYSSSGASMVNPFVNNTQATHGGNVGLHFTPTLELRYAF
jgi:hypothetical protein